MEQLEQEIRELQSQLEIAIGNNDVSQAHWLETEIDEKQQALIRLKQAAR